jgi:RNA polymerase sigma-70 factor (ECF subfamily)
MNAIGQPESGTSTARCVLEHKPWGNRPTESARLSGTANGHSVELRRDSELLRALHDEHARSLLSYVVGLTHDRASAQDVVQETLLRASRNAAVVERASGSPRGWLFTVARRIVIDQWRSASRRPEVLTNHVPEQPVEDTAQRTVDRQLVRSALRTLPIEHRQVLFDDHKSHMKFPSSRRRNSKDL